MPSRSVTAAHVGTTRDFTMRPASPDTPSTRSHKPRAFTVFAAAFVAGAAAAVGVNSLLDVRLAQAKPRVESEPIFVALRSLPQGAPVTVWDVALRDWPRAMVPTSALRASDAFSGLVLKHPLREGQPLLSIQLLEADATTPSSPPPVTTISAATTPATGRVPDADLWAPAAPAAVSAAATTEQRPQAEPQPVAPGPRGAEQSAGSVAVTDVAVTAPVTPTMTAASPAVSPAAPPADAVATTPRDAEPTAAVPVIPDMPQVAPEATAAAAAPADEAFTDEILEAMAATTAPQAEAFVAQPDEAVIAAPAVAASPSDRGPSQEPEAERPIAAAADAPTADVVKGPPTPTLADPPLASIGGAPTVADSGAFKSVMRPTTADAAPAAVPAPPRVARYLVVPENIALQADASFAAVRQPAPQPAPRSGGTGVQPLPPTAGQQPAKQPAQRASQPRRGTSAAVPGGGQRPGTQKPGPQQPADQQARRGGMFPNIAAGIETIDAELGRMRRDRSGQPEQPAPARPQY